MPKPMFHKMGMVRDLRFRVDKARKFLINLVMHARRFIYELALPISGAAVNRLLKAVSAVPTMVSASVQVLI